MARPDFQLRRLRSGEIIAALAGLAFLALILFAPWYGTDAPLSPTARLLGAATSFTGWSALSHLRWLFILTVLSALALFYFQATRRSPALPVCLSVIVTALAFLTAIVLVYRVLISIPGGVLGRKYGSYLGLAADLMILLGAFWSMREEGIDERDGPGEIPVIELGGASAAS